MAESKARFSENEKRLSGKQGYKPLDEEPEPEKFHWDKFKEISADSVSSRANEFWQIIHKVAKVIFAIILFIFVLSTAVLHKSTLFVLLSNISPPNKEQNFSLKTQRNHFQYPTSETSIIYIWAIVLILVSPYMFTTLSSLWSLIFKKHPALEFKPLLFTFIIETLHSVGINLFVFGLLPALDPVSGALFCTNIVAVPAVLRLFDNGADLKGRLVKRVLSILGIAAAFSSMALWTFYLFNLYSKWQTERMGLLVISVLTPLLVSVVWWNNYVPKKFGYLTELRKQVQNMRSKIYSIVSIWKILLTISMVSILYGTGCREGTKCLETLYGATDENRQTLNKSINNSNVTLDHWFLGPTTLVLDVMDESCSKYLPLYIAVVNIVSGLVCFRCCIAANQILAQVPSFSLPLALSTPITLLFMITLYASQTLTLTGSCVLPFPKFTDGLEFDWTMIAASILGYTAIVTVTSHIWNCHSKHRMQSGDRIFSLPMYCGLFLDQSLILNRKRNESEVSNLEANKDLTNDGDLPGETPKIYVCATMWHEADREMTQLLKSIFRLDIDQFDQWTKHQVEVNHDFYELEVHIFFDDAFETRGGKRQINEYVRKLIKNMADAHRCVYGDDEDRKMDLPSKADTPYGGKLVWILPFENKLIAHLKDKEKIRHRKRWSQVMYMYYLLSYKLENGDSAENTFILALDGDVDFQPSALKLLVDIMKINDKVGAACGRILPIGAGPMVWYQKFEYAVSHWLQKATEHTVGCVLCSPGCFSLFRGSHLMAENVMKRYTTPPTEARHYVQYDQGEDRWLCTLLLQQGFRVEYCAASDALTYAPEGFYEFYNQRRRWTPSTMANILDLLLDFRNVTERNSDISMLYIGYQMLLMVSSILTPGTIFLMILGAINMAYPSLSLYWALILNLIPVALFIVFCFLAKPSTQLAYAAVLSTVYSLVMMLVIVGLIKQAADNGFCSVTTVFLCFVAGVFVIAAFIHPQEFWCILHGFLYFLAIPSMSMLLMLYSIGNLHVVSWGTRETAKPVEDQQSTENAQKGKGSTVKEWLAELGIARESEYMFSFGNLLRCICCPNDKRDDKDVKFKVLLGRFDALESAFVSHDKSPPQTNFEDAENTQEKQSINTESITDEQNEGKEVSYIFGHDKSVKGKKTKIKKKEKAFWEQLIKTYLYPLNEDKEHQKKTEAELIELRNKVCLFFILTNALFVTIVFSLQQVNLDSGGSISKELPCANGHRGGSFEPISMAFTGVFGVLLFIQFVCMIIHRMSTFLQICSITEVSEKHQNEEDKVEQNMKILKDCKMKDNPEDVAVCESEEESTDASSDGLEDENVIDMTRHRKSKHIGPRSQFKKTLRFLSQSRGNSAVVAEEMQKSLIGVDMTNLKKMVALSMDGRFQKSIHLRGQQIARQKTVKSKAQLSVTMESPHENISMRGRRRNFLETQDDQSDLQTEMF